MSMTPLDLMLEVMSRMDSDGRFHMLGALCAMQNEGKIGADVVECCCTEVSLYGESQFSNLVRVRKEIDQMCSSGYFSPRVKLDKG